MPPEPPATWPNTLRNWTNAGRVQSIRLPSGHRRFTEAQLEAIRQEMGLSAEGIVAAPGLPLTGRAMAG